MVDCKYVKTLPDCTIDSLWIRSRNQADHGRNGSFFIVHIPDNPTLWLTIINEYKVLFFTNINL